MSGQLSEDMCDRQVIYSDQHDMSLILLNDESRIFQLVRFKVTIFNLVNVSSNTLEGFKMYITNPEDIFFMYVFELRRDDFTTFQDANRILSPFENLPKFVVNLLEKSKMENVKSNSRPYLDAEKKSDCLNLYVLETIELKPICHLFFKCIPACTYELKQYVIVAFKKLQNSKDALKSQFNKLYNELQQLALKLQKERESHSSIISRIRQDTEKELRKAIQETKKRAEDDVSDWLVKINIRTSAMEEELKLYIERESAMLQKMEEANKRSDYLNQCNIELSNSHLAAVERASQTMLQVETLQTRLALTDQRLSENIKMLKQSEEKNMQMEISLNHAMKVDLDLKKRASQSDIHLKTLLEQMNDNYETVQKLEKLATENRQLKQALVNEKNSVKQLQTLNCQARLEVEEYKQTIKKWESHQCANRTVQSGVENSLQVQQPATNVGVNNNGEPSGSTLNDNTFMQLGTSSQVQRIDNYMWMI